MSEPLPARRRDYTHSFWKNSWRRHADIDKSPDILCFESGYYGLSFNTADLTSAQFKLLEDDELSYTDVIENRGRMEGLDDVRLVVEVRLDNKTFRAKQAHPVNKDIGLCHGRLWEAGRIVQHYELVGIILEDENGSSLKCMASIFIVTWAPEFSITLSLQPLEDQTWKDGATIRIRLGDWSTQQPFSGPWTPNQVQEVTLSCSVNELSGNSSNLQDLVSLDVKNKSALIEKFNVSHNAHFSCFVADIKNPKRNFETGYTDIRDADIFDVQVENASDENIYIPVMFYLRAPANVTGLVPMLWVPEDDTKDAEYVPSGIPVQTSKNWHCKPIGNYLRAYALLPTQPGSQQFEFRVYYGFYGPLCSASHANLSLVGYTKHGEYSTAGRWEQLAIGCFGETICFDIEMSLTDVTITDVRALMVKKGKPWAWTNAGWGGDWLCLFDDGRKLLLGGVKVGYLSQGPCLTEVRYSGYYGVNAEVHVNATVHTFRADDYARTFQKIRYDFNSTVAVTYEPNTGGSCLFRVGGGAGWEGWFCKKVALGNRDGLIEEVEIPSTLKVGEFFVDRMKMSDTFGSGSGPWWIAVPESDFKSDQKDFGNAWKCLIIRSYRSNVKGVTRLVPKVSLYARQDHGDGDYYVDILVTPNRGIEMFNEGDSVELDVEWVTFPYSAEDYYGPNQSFRQHLEENPKSWKTAFREATGNNLTVAVNGGNVINTYPVIISVSDAVVGVSIKGGVGAVPVRFEGLNSKSYRLSDDSQPETNMEWYETAFCPETRTYSMTFNLPLDDRHESSWTLK